MCNVSNVKPSGHQSRRWAWHGLSNMTSSSGLDLVVLVIFVVHAAPWGLERRSLGRGVMWTVSGSLTSDVGGRGGGGGGGFAAVFPMIR